MKNSLLAFLAIIALNFSATAQPDTMTDRWGKGAFISAPSSTLNGVKPLANWIWDEAGENPLNYYLLARKTFHLDELPKSAKAFISAYAYADVYINGKLLERCPVNCDPEYQCYDYFDISKFLHKGENCISAVVQNFGIGLHSQINARAGFFFQGKLDFDNDASIDLLSDSSWKTIPATAWSSATRLRVASAHLIGFVEEFDARLWPEGWKMPGFDDSQWRDAVPLGVPPVAPWNHIVVIERPRLLREVVKPVRSWKSGNLMVYDFGTEIVGYPQFTVDAAKEGVQFEIGTGERLDKDKAPLIKIPYTTDHSEKYTTKTGLQSWRPYTWSGFRYLSIETSPDVRIVDVSAEYSHFNYEQDSSFECSDPQLNDFWKIGKHTIQIYTTDIWADPWREHTQYIAGDSRYLEIYGNYAFGKSTRFLAAYNLLCGAESQRWHNDGSVRARYPTDYLLRTGSSAYLADYQLEYVIMMREYFLYFGKDPLVESLYPNMKKALEYFLPSVDPKTGLLANLPGWIVLDWPDTYRMEMKKIITGVNCEYYGALTSAATIAEDFANDPEQAAIWKEQARQLRDNINRELWSEKDRAYLDSFGGTKAGQQPQIYALMYGLPDESRKADMIKYIMSKGKDSEESFAYWTLNTMFSAGQEQWALDYMRKNWGGQTKLDSFNGAWHEGWNLPWGATSHGWSSGPTALLPQKILGLEPTGYGWSTFRVKPYVCDLTWAKGNVSTVSGNIATGWKISGGSHFTMNLTIPKDTTASVYLPPADLKSVTVDGKPLAERPELKAGQEDERCVIPSLGAGSYQFECELAGK